ncbi:MAG: hypothetical protein KKA65_03600 [Nanoarchaeota archaeon]|nr:hypothetical protein [Nanoarchaeota archaeon]MBU4241682.1 hypothetical protein [Nanoarchaeota archaeon]MBU4351707.1 hypothetical protein [Nanoarchaeota archaeon]MBU4456562.1 hypothetical protein [Nanoarchaeota archaeon]MCG2719931.1 hypothetical protein [Nanoarchaeota archaeon]
MSDYKEKWKIFREKLDTKSILFGVVLGVVAGTYGFMRINHFGFFDRNIPTNETVQQGYVAPENVKGAPYKDVDGNGEKEFYININGTDYPLKWFKKTKPYLDLDNSNEFEQCLEQCVRD